MGREAKRRIEENLNRKLERIATGIPKMIHELMTLEGSAEASHIIHSSSEHVSLPQRLAGNGTGILSTCCTNYSCLENRNMFLCYVADDPKIVQVTE